MNNAEIIAKSKAFLMNTYARAPMALVRGQGARVWDADGKEYLDFLGGIAVNVLGHCHPRVVEAISQQAKQLIHCSNLYHIEPQVKLAEILVRHSFADKVFFCNSGAEANEGAIKLARKWAKGARGPESYEIVTTLRSFHGRTLATLAATGQTKYHEGFEPLPPGFVYVPFNDLEAFEAAVGPQTAGVMVEPVQGEGGIHPADPEYLRGLRRICDEQGLALIFDEVQTGMGRCGTLFAHQAYRVEPDIMTLAKGLGGGVAIGAILTTDRFAQTFGPGSHGSTFGGNPLVTAAAVATLTTILEERLHQNAQRVGEYLRMRLEGIRHNNPVVREVRGRGLMLALELTVPCKEAVESCRQAGLLVNCTEGNVLRLLPPLNIDVQLIDEALAILERVLAETAAQVAVQ